MKTGAEENIELRNKMAKNLFGGTDEKLYLKARLFNQKDKLLGIQNNLYADIELNATAEKLSAKTRKSCKEFAVVAFWDLQKDTDVFKCSRFFIIPDPVKRIIRELNETVVYQILFVSDKTDDVFFFWKESEETLD